MARVVRKQKPPPLTDHRKFKPYLRLDFDFRCAYCHLPEVRNGGSRNFVVEHFRPKSKFPKLACVYRNLHYACNSCNEFKADTWPEPAESGDGWKFVDPCDSEMSAHTVVLDDGVVVPATRAGHYTCTHLHLNRSFLRIWRERKRHLENQIVDMERFLQNLMSLPPSALDLAGAQILRASCDAHKARLEAQLLEEYGSWW